jgi:hypothetical protein
MQDPSTGELHPVGVFPLDSPEAVQRARDLKWKEFHVDEVVQVKGSEFIVRWIGKDAILLQPVRPAPSVIEVLVDQADALKRLRGERIG